MIQNKFGELVFNENDLANLVMQGNDVTDMKNVVVAPTVDIKFLASLLTEPKSLLTWAVAEDSDLTVPEFDEIKQSNWYMPEEYKQLDIAAYLLDLCSTEAQLQRVGEELLLFQEHDLFELLQYLKYLVDTLREHHVIWGVGRGSSVASYVLYLLGVHKIDSLYYDLDPREFLR